MTLKLQWVMLPMDTVQLVVADNNDLIQQNTQELVMDHKDEFKHCMVTYDIEDGT